MSAKPILPNGQKYLCSASYPKFLIIYKMGRDLPQLSHEGYKFNCLPKFDGSQLVNIDKWTIEVEDEKTGQALKFEVEYHAGWTNYDDPTVRCVQGGTNATIGPVAISEPLMPAFASGVTLEKVATRITKKLGISVKKQPHGHAAEAARLKPFQRLPDAEDSADSIARRFQQNPNHPGLQKYSIKDYGPEKIMSPERELSKYLEFDVQRCNVCGAVEPKKYPACDTCSHDRVHAVELKVIDGDKEQIVILPPFLK